MATDSDHLLNTLEDERRYVARELHDGVAQTTLQLGLQIGICRKLAELGKVEMLNSELAQLEGRIQLASSQVRDLISDMRPPVVEAEASLDDHLAYVIDIHGQRGGPAVEVQSTWSADSVALTQLQTVALARIIQEALLNVRKHASAKSVTLALALDEDRPRVTISDDGVGFDWRHVQTLPVDKGGAGLANMAARARAIGGTLEIETAPAEGATITVSL